MKLVITVLLFTYVSLMADESAGKKLFQEYCWGCHHETAMAFGPSFQSIANKRSREEVMAQIADPDDTYKSLGYKTNSMPAFNDLNSSEIKALTDYIYKFKDKK
jgi:mono/diheme cytochrome c family protein